MTQLEITPAETGFLYRLTLGIAWEIQIEIKAIILSQSLRKELLALNLKRALAVYLIFENTL